MFDGFSFFYYPSEVDAATDYYKRHEADKTQVHYAVIYITSKHKFVVKKVQAIIMPLQDI